MSGKGVQQCVASHVNKETSQQTAHTCQYTPRKSARAQMAQGAYVPEHHAWRSFLYNTRYQVSGVHYPLFIISFFVVGTPCGFVIYAGFPLPTRHTLNATSKLVTARIHVHSTQICMMVSGHWAQSTKYIR